MSSKIDFNKAIMDCADAISLDQGNRGNRTFTYKTEKDYLTSLKENIGSFKLTETQKKSVEVILYNNGNNDGVASASIVYHYLQSHNIDPLLIGMRPGFIDIQRQFSRIRDKKVIILDIAQSSKEDYKKIEAVVDTMFVIDDHTDVGYSSPTYFTSNNGHAACACTWAIFYPKKPAPLLIQMIDVSDTKKHAKYFGYSHLLVSALAFRYTSNPYKPRSYFTDGSLLKQFWDIMENKKEKLLILIGQYMHETQENIKEQIARNAVIRHFQGYKVGVLNFADPVLTKRVGRQIVSNMNRKDHKIDFAVLWAYEYNKDLYKVTLIDDHRQTRLNMGEIATKLGKVGNTGKGGFGRQHEANFYWPKSNTKDIWDLFKKQYI